LTFIGSLIMVVLLFARYFLRGARRKNLCRSRTTADDKNAVRRRNRNKLARRTTGSFEQNKFVAVDGAGNFYILCSVRIQSLLEQIGQQAFSLEPQVFMGNGHVS